ncbi:hypothetical protein [Desulfolucanica intricata]|uniref:hypothetical protein n=1 Tax=Desulfolucanica intricata TaxID=1285191 RepID=UPI0008311775|nr:hypothetical protein [Desulfolucanica intricata]
MNWPVCRQSRTGELRPQSGFDGTLADMHADPGARACRYNKATHDQVRPQRITPKLGLVMCGFLIYTLFTR